MYNFVHAITHSEFSPDDVLFSKIKSDAPES